MNESLAIDVFFDNKLGGFKIIQKWTHQFMKHCMNWTFKVNIIIVSKLPLDWQEQGRYMAYHVTYLTKTYDIPPSLVVNNDQIGIHLVPTIGKCTWENNGSKHVHVLGIEDKRQVIVIISSFVTWVLLPLQIIFTSTTPWTLPPNNNQRKMCVTNGWELNYSDNHWSNLEMTIQYVENVMVFYHKAQIELLEL